MRARLWSLLFSLGCLAAMPCPVSAQEPPTSETDTRRATIEQAQEEKQGALHPFVPEKGERLLNKLDALRHVRTPDGIRFWRAPTPAAASQPVPAISNTSAATTSWICAAATRWLNTSALRPNSRRLACSNVEAPCP